MSDGFFKDVAQPISFGGLDSNDPLTYKVYEPDRLVLGKRMEEHLRIAVCMWHSFASPGEDMFGSGTFDRPWLGDGLDPIAAGRAKLDAAFEFVAKLGVPYFCFHDRDIAPEGRTFAETKARLEAMVDYAGEHMARTGVKLLYELKAADGKAKKVCKQCKNAKLPEAPAAEAPAEAAKE